MTTTLNLNQPANDAAVNSALAKLPPVADNVAVLARHLQKQLDALAARVAVLEGP